LLGNILRFLNNHNVVINIILAMLGVIIIPIVGLIFRKIKENISKNRQKELVFQKEQSIYLNKPYKKDNCLGRDAFLKKVYNKIKGEEPNLYVGNHIYIAGMEGIGKTLFCQTLCLIQLKYAEIYIGWVECKGKLSIFKIISNIFDDPRFKRKNKRELLNSFENLEKPCVLFIDQIDQYTPIEEIRELTSCPNLTIIVSGVLKNISFIDDNMHFRMEPLSESIIRRIFEDKSGELISEMSFKNKSDVTLILFEYVKGNPFLVTAFARAKAQNNTWSDLLQNMLTREYDKESDNYIKTVLTQLYKIRQLSDDDKSTLSKLAVFSSLEFVKEVFEWCDIPMECVVRLCRTYWLGHNDSVIYNIEDVHRDVLRKVLIYKDVLMDLITSITDYLNSWELYEDKGFNQISFYIEDIFKEAKYNYLNLDEHSEIFAQFTYIVAEKYGNIYKWEESLEWIKNCNPSNKNKQLMYDKAVHKFKIGWILYNSHFTLSEVEKYYFDALEIAKRFKDHVDKEKFLLEEYCGFLNRANQYDKVKAIYEKYFATNGFNFNDDYCIDMFFRYLCMAKNSNDQKLLQLLVSNENLSSLLSSQCLTITLAWCFREFVYIYEKMGNMKLVDICKRKMVILINRLKCFFHNDIKYYINMSENEFIDYMHSHEELKESLKEAIEREDSEALYLEGKYQERNGNLKDAFSLYEISAMNDNLRGMCALAIMYYQGKVVAQNFDKAREYLEYCCEREHRDSFYWLGILFLDINYYNNDKEKAIHYLKKAFEMGSEKARSKLLEINESTDLLNESGNGT